jgi:hypothetical protein
VAGSFAATWGTAGVVPVFQTGFSAVKGHVSRVPLHGLSGAADAGPSLTDPNPHRGALNLYLKRSNGTFVVIPFRVDPTQLKTGAVLPIDGKQVDASLVFTDGVTTGGFLDRGILKIYSAWIAPGGRVCGTFEAPTYFFSNRDLAKSHGVSEGEGHHHLTEPEWRGADQHLGDVIAHCLPPATTSPAFSLR